MTLQKILSYLRALWAGQKGLGTTFWVGVFIINALAAFGFVWLEFLAAILKGGASHMLLRALITLFYLIGFLYNLLLLGGLWRTARATPEVGGWRWIGLLLGFGVLLIYGYMIVLFRP